MISRFCATVSGNGCTYSNTVEFPLVCVITVYAICRLRIRVCETKNNPHALSPWSWNSTPHLGPCRNSELANRMPLRSADFRRQIHWNLIFYFFHFLTCGSLRLSRRWASELTWEDGRLIVDLRLLAQIEKDTKFRKFSLVRSWPYCGGSSGLKPLRRRAPYPLFKRSRLHCLHVYLTLWHIKLWWR